MRTAFLGPYSTRQARIYFVLSAPALVLEFVFATGLVLNLGGVAASVGGDLALVVGIVPWAVLIVAIFAFLRFRPSLLVATLAFSFFLSAVTGSQAGLLGTQGGFGLTAGLVVIGVFCALIGFSYSRGASLQGGRDLRAESQGPVGFQVLGVSLEFGAPLLITLGVIALVSAIVGAANSEVNVLPQPLSTISSLYLSTRVGLASVVILVAGLAIWTTREFLEPVILYYTLTYDEAIDQALGEVDDVRKSIVREKKVSWIPPLAASEIALVAIVVLSAHFLGTGTMVSELKSVLTFHSSSPSSSETNLVMRANQLEAQMQYILNTIFRMLWG
jgi:hypothetical protein